MGARPSLQYQPGLFFMSHRVFLLLVKTEPRCVSELRIMITILGLGQTITFYFLAIYQPDES